VSVADVLNAAADLLEPEGRWTRGHAARAVGGMGVDFNSPDASCWCAWGALAKVSGGNEVEAFEALTDHLQLEQEIDPALFGEIWNDAPERTQAEVVQALRDAALKVSGNVPTDAVGTKAQSAEVNQKDSQ